MKSNTHDTYVTRAAGATATKYTFPTHVNDAVAHGVSVDLGLGSGLKDKDTFKISFTNGTAPFPSPSFLIASGDGDFTLASDGSITAHETMTQLIVSVSNATASSLTLNVVEDKGGVIQLTDSVVVLTDFDRDLPTQAVEVA